MQVLLLDDNPRRHEDVMMAFIKSGFQITATSSLRVAETYLDFGVIDLLVVSEKLNGRLSHGTALYAEHRNPMLSTIMITERVGDDVEELYDLIPSVHCIVGANVPGKTIVELGKASVSSKTPMMSFTARRVKDADVAPMAEAAPVPARTPAQVPEPQSKSLDTPVPISIRAAA